MTAPHEKGRDCRRTDEVLDNYRRRAIRAELALAPVSVNPYVSTDWPQEYRIAQARAEAATSSALEAQVARNRVVAQWHRSGASMRQIAAATGLSLARVGQIVKANSG